MSITLDTIPSLPLDQHRQPRREESAPETWGSIAQEAERAIRFARDLRRDDVDAQLKLQAEHMAYAIDLMIQARVLHIEEMDKRGRMLRQAAAIMARSGGHHA